MEGEKINTLRSLRKILYSNNYDNPTKESIIEIIKLYDEELREYDKK
jgi:hypothetical protein